jgi:hypothetical protein
MDRPNIYDQASCIANDGFCSTQCLDQDPHFCAAVVLPNTTATTNPTTTVTDSTSPITLATTTGDVAPSVSSVSSSTTGTTAAPVSCLTALNGASCKTDEDHDGRCVEKLATGCLPLACANGTEFCAAQPAGFASVWTVGECVGAAANRTCVVPEENIDTCLLKAVGEACNRAAGTTTEPGVCLRNSAGQVKCVPTLECQKVGDVCTLTAGGFGECKADGDRIKCDVSGTHCYEQGAACTLVGTTQQGRCEPDGEHGLFCSALKQCSKEGDRCTAASETAVASLVDGTCVLNGAALTCEPNWYANSNCVPGRDCRTIADREGKCYRVATKCPTGLVCAQVLRHVCLAEVCIVSNDNCRLPSGERGICSRLLECEDPTARAVDVSSAAQIGSSIVSVLVATMTMKAMMV